MLQPNCFELERTTVWSFPDRGSWATHNGKYRGNWSPYVPRNIIERYSKKNEWILDQFVGSGTTLIEAKLLNRNAIGVDINPEAVLLTKKQTDFHCESTSRNVTEILLFGIRGDKNKTLGPARSQVNLIRKVKREHSRKPDEIIPIIEACSPGPYLELFARGVRPGWDGVIRQKRIMNPPGQPMQTIRKYRG